MTTTLTQARALAGSAIVDPRYPINTYTLDPIWVLYDQILNITPETADSPVRDRFLLSKGHGPGAYYAVLAAKGFIPEAWLGDVAGTDAALGAHPDTTRVPGVEISAGSLGHGLPLGVGQALGLRAQGLVSPRVFVLVGDAELDEGSNDEAIAFAGAIGLDRLTVIVADNASATHGRPGGMAARFDVHGWTVSTVDMADHEGLASAYRANAPGQPHAVIATVNEGAQS